MKYLFSIFILISFCVKSQKFQDTIIGNPKYVREYVSFLTEKQNPQFLYNSDYGHEGFLGNEFTKKEFKEIWFNYDFVYYINYEKFYKKINNSLLIKENWFYKDHSFLASFSKEFYNGKLTKLVLDSSAVNRYKTIFINYKNRNPKQIRLMKFSKTKDYNTRKYFFKKNQLKKISRYVNGRKQYDSVFVYDKKNLVEEYVLHKRKWKNMMEKDTPLQTPKIKANNEKLGVYEGGGYLYKGVYRQWLNCMMNNFHTIDILCPVCVKAIQHTIDINCK